MKHITFYLDFISPYAHLAFEQLPEALVGIGHSVAYRPVFLGGLLRHHGQLGPAEIAPKRDWTYRQVLWLAREQGVALQMPSSHPFNPLPLLRLAVACDAAGEPGRHVCERIFRHVWHGGAAADDAARVAELTLQLAPARAPTADEVKAQLTAHTTAAAAQGVFGVPLFEVDGKHFWGLDALPMLRQYLLGDAWFDEPWDAATRVANGLRR